MNKQTDYNKGYFVDDVFVEWSTSYEDVVQILKQKDLKESPYDFNTSFECSCSHAFGFSTVLFNANGLYSNKNRPILNVSYDLLANDPASIDSDKYLNPLKKLLGTPDKREQTDTTSWASVKFYACWNLQSVKISLSVFGAAREVNGYLCGASIFIQYKNMKHIAKPFLEQSQKMENELFSTVKELSYFTVFKLDKVKPFYVPDYSSQDPNAALSDDLFRISQKALYKRNLLETPDFIKEKLANNEFVIWQNKHDLFEYYCSTKWDTSVIFLKSKRNKIILCNMLPAKGSGGVSLEINELSLQDKYGSKTLFEAFELLEKLLDQKLSYREEYDC